MADKWADKWANSEKNEDNCKRALHLLMNSRCSVFFALRMRLHVPRYNDFANNICYNTYWQTVGNKPAIRRLCAGRTS